MPPSSELRSRLWLILPLLVAVYWGMGVSARVQRVRHVTTVVPAEAAPSAASPTGYAGGIRLLVLPEQAADSSGWIMQTQQMLAEGELRVRHLAYENAPQGRTNYTASPYRWWLGAVAWVDHTFLGRPLGQSVEQAAIWADPLLQAIVFVLAVWLTKRGFGPGAAAMLAVGLVGLFPWAGEFIPGQPDDKALARAFALLGMCGLLAAVQSSRHARRWFFAAGVLGSVGLWVKPAELVPLLAALGVGAAGAILFTRQAKEAPPAADAGGWLAWSLGGAAGCLLFYGVEYAPDHLAGWRLPYLHPLHGLAWLGLGLGLWTLAVLCRREVAGRKVRVALAGVGALVALLALPLVAWLQQKEGALGAEAWTFRLTRLSGGIEGTSLWDVLKRDGASLPVIAVLLPVALIAPGLWVLRRRGSDLQSRALLALTLGTTVPLLGFAFMEIGHWSSLGIPLLALLVVLAAGGNIAPGLQPRWLMQAALGLVLAAGESSATSARPRWLMRAGLGLVLIPGFWVMHSRGDARTTPLDESELGGLIARDLAHRLAQRTGEAPVVVLAPPETSALLAYYGGLRGLGSLDRENRDASGAASRIFSATTPQEALARIQNRSIGLIVVPSWSRTLDEYVRLNGAQADDAFLAGLRNWAPLPWLKPVAYQLPAVSGYEGQSVAVFAVVDEQSEAEVLAVQAEYFAEMGRLDYALALSKSLQRFPRQLTAWIARGQVALARQDGAGLGEAVQAILPQLSAGADRGLVWERRAALAAVLQQGRQRAAAEALVRRCLTEVTEPRLRNCSTLTLYRLLMLAKSFGIEIADPSLRTLAPSLLPPEWRSRL